MRKIKIKPSKASQTDRFEKNRMFAYLANFLSRKSNIREFLPRIGEWYEDYGSKYLKIELMSNDELNEYDNFETFAKKKKSEALKRADKLFLKVCDKLHTAKPSKPSNLQQKINLVGDLIKLSNIEKDILGYYVSLKFNSDVENLKDTLFGHCHDKYSQSSYFLTYSQNQIENYLHQSDKLLSCGLLDMEYDGDISLSSKGAQLFSQKFKKLTDLRKIVLGEQMLSSLEWQDFKHIENKDFCAKILKKGIAAKYKGLNILLYGEPGTGKTEFAKALCRQAGAELYAVGEKSDDRNRLECLNMAQNIVHKDNKICFLIDEADDLMDEKKIRINRILENNDIPCIWIVNSIRYWDKAYLRRFTYAMDFKKPELETRKEIIEKTLQKNNFKATSEITEMLAKEYTLPPSFIATSIKTIKMIKGKPEEICTSLDAMEKAYNNGMEKPKKIERKKEEKKPLDFNVSLLNTDTDLAKLALQLKEQKRTKFSLCLYGVSGTGKSAYGEYLAEQLNMPVVKKRCSDLLSKWYGEAEQNIARAFNEAKDKHALLIFDEADSFLYDRQNSTHSWEVTQVNEMLTQMEKHEFPFVCTTNLIDNLDKASLRRFTFKVEYKYMTPEQNTQAFAHFFGIKDVDLSHISSLTPGDFVVVKAKAEIMGYLNNMDELIKMLEMEQKQKDPVTHRIGFC